MAVPKKFIKKNNKKGKYVGFLRNTAFFQRRVIFCLKCRKRHLFNFCT